MFERGAVLALEIGMLRDVAGLNPLTQKIIGCGMEVHRAFGAGLLESIYHACLILELRSQGLHVDIERKIDITYRGVPIGLGFKVDLIVEGQVLVEVKAVQEIAPVHRAQVITYLKLTGCQLGLLMNFNVPLLKDGIVRLLHPVLMRG
jgi:GxxExxY protein